MSKAGRTLGSDGSTKAQKSAAGKALAGAELAPPMTKGTVTGRAFHLGLVASGDVAAAIAQAFSRRDAVTTRQQPWVMPIRGKMRNVCCFRAAR